MIARRIDEERLLGCLLDRPLLIDQVRRNFYPSYLAEEDLRILYGVFLRIGSLTAQSALEYLRAKGIPRPGGDEWGTLLSDLISGGAELADSAVSVHVNAIRSRALDQRAHELIQGAATASGNGDVREVSRRLQKDLEEIDREAAARPLIASGFLTGSELLEFPLLPSQPILAGGAFTTGVYGAGYGLDGAAKSMGFAHLVMDAAAGVPWFGIDTCGPMSIAYLYSDDDRDEVRRRLMAVAVRDSIDRPEVWDRLHVLARPYPWGSSLDITEQRNREDLIGYMLAHSIRLAVFDHIAAFHRLPAFDYMPLVDALDEIATKAGVGILIAGHPPKAGARAKPDDPAADDMAGDRRLMNFARFRIRFTRADRDNLFRIRFEKVNRGGRPPDIWVEQEPSENPDPSLWKSEMVAKAKAAKDDRIARIPKILSGQPGKKMDGEQLAATLGLKSERSLRRYKLPDGVLRDDGIYLLIEPNPDLIEAIE